VREKEKEKKRRGGEKVKIIGKKKENIKGNSKKEMREGYYRYFTLLSM
jgi:hypothetical protein